MISRRDSLRYTEEAYAKARAEEMQLETALRSRSQEAARLRRERLRQFRALAELKLDHIKRGELIAQLHAAEQHAKELIEKDERALSEAEDRRREALEALENAQRGAGELKLSYDAALAELRSFEERAEPAIAGDPDWIARRDAVEETRRTLEHAEQKARIADVDRQKKRIPYEQDRLFMYLWERKFGSSDYRSGSFVRFFDDLIAGLVGYREASANYSLLNQIPDRLRAHVDQVRAKLEQQQQDLALFRQERLQKAGGGPLQKKAAEAKSSLEAGLTLVVEARERFEAVDKEYAALIGRDDHSAFNQAIEAIAKSDSHSDISALYAEAERTGGDKDRAVVARIDELTKTLSACEEEVAQLRGRIRETAAKRADIQRAHAEATVADVLGGIVGGVVSGVVLGQVLQQGHAHAQGSFGPENALGQLTSPGSLSPPPVESDGGFTSGGGF